MDKLKKLIFGTKKTKPDQQEGLYQSLLGDYPTEVQKQALETQRKQMFQEIFYYQEEDCDFFIRELIKKYAYCFNQTDLCQAINREFGPGTFMQHYPILSDVSKRVLAKQTVDSHDLQAIFSKYFDSNKVESLRQANPDIFKDALGVLPEFMRDVVDIAPLVQNEKVLNKDFLKTIRRMMIKPVECKGKTLICKRSEEEIVEVFKSMAHKIPE